MIVSGKNTFNVLDYGAAGDGQTLDTVALQAAIEACSQAGGGTVYVPAGQYVTGSLFLRNHITLFLDAGATLLGSQNTADYPPVANRWEGVSRITHAPLIGGEDLTHIAVVGRGTVDGRGAFWWELGRRHALDYPRPRLISFSHCTNVLMEGITCTNSPSWTLHPYACDNVTVDKVTIANPADSPNTDGINPESCRNVHIANCHIDVGDDCITIKSGTEEEERGRLLPCENITITNCTMVHGHGGVVIGSEMSGGVRNITIANCVFVGTDRGIRLKSRRERGGIVEDIRVTNVVMTDVMCPFIMNLYYGCGAWGTDKITDRSPWPVNEGTPRFRRVHFSDITARDVRYAAAFLYGLPEMPVEDVAFSNVDISMALDAEPGVPAMAPDLEPMQRAGFWATNVRGLRFHNVTVADQLGPALLLADAADVEINGFTTPTPSAGTPVIHMRNVAGAFVHGCQAAAGTDAFLRVEGEQTRDIVLSDNSLPRAARAVDRTADVPVLAIEEK
ncbi:MAG TPA: glycoside hydrolase family 28 protein [Anaerolineae bacterium]|nr:glycoside hydrolase family 28 protein [Anaerolineae bacterium]HQH37255.1 glycoside hydrolase family 28 protein [Anaerolineae bacterium]